MVKSNLLLRSLVPLYALALVLGMQTQTAAEKIAQTIAPQNNLTPEIAPAQNIPIYQQQPPTNITQTTNLVLKLSDRRVYLYRDNILATSYPVAIGKAGWETPVGKYKVIEMQRDPSWQHPWTGKIIPPGADNPLGARWIGFWTDGKNFIGFHGTPQEKLIGQAVSHGCVRMRNKDILSLYAQVDIGTPVTVTP
ncbi:L,D-transpeptidase [Aliterella atlantica]|uniref:ErfK/YbiS/YcfS/YnhG family protein n=1 Tax=Aliterella atlantica CENA595 TaxID=1618023 RepID=A0A0D8ZMA7_9CYAN|nr:L,D-transpeptidase [Aliterella atlantica]KJH69870.1 ErfK/YbiS/YcfS/YnhG family protein [Aliterella atlantica CENA595]